MSKSLIESARLPGIAMSNHEAFQMKTLANFMTLRMSLFSLGLSAYIESYVEANILIAR